jgi:hypothetical protein
MKTLGLPRNDAFRAVTASSTPYLITKRQTCFACSRNFSVGQFPINSAVCQRCLGLPPGWRRGDVK